MTWLTQLTAVSLRCKLNFDYSKVFHRISVVLFKHQDICDSIWAPYNSYEL